MYILRKRKSREVAKLNFHITYELKSTLEQWKVRVLGLENHCCGL